jgi:hypothetical protein
MMTTDSEKEHKEQEGYNETTVTLRLPKNYYKTGHAVPHLLGYESFEHFRYLNVYSYNYY